MPRFRFRLRTLLIVVTLFALIPCGYVGWQAKIVRHRKWVLSHLETKPAASIDPWSRKDPEPVPWIRRTLGDEALDWIGVDSNASESDFNAVVAIPRPRLNESSWLVLAGCFE